MALIIHTTINHMLLPGGGAPYGNVTAMDYPVVTNEDGRWIDGDAKEANASGDVLRIGILPKGFRPLEAYLSVNKAISGLQGKVGFTYCDGEDDADVPQKDDAWFTAADFGSEGITRRDGGMASPRLPKDAYVEVATTGAASGAGEAHVILVGIAEGPV